VQEGTIHKLRCDKLKLSEALREERQHADDAREDVRLLTEELERIQEEMHDQDRKSSFVTMRHLRATRASDEQIKALTGWPTLKTFDALWRFVNAGDRNATQNLSIVKRKRRGDSTSATGSHGVHRTNVLLRGRESENAKKNRARGRERKSAQSVVMTRPKTHSSWTVGVKSW